MNPKNPQAASEGFVLVPREPTLAMIRAAYYPDGSQAHMLAREVSRLRREYKAMLAAAPAIAPGGDALRLFDDLLYRLAGQIGDSNADFSHKIVSNYYRELDLIRKALAPAGDVRTPMTTDLPAAANAVTVDDAMRKALRLLRQGLYDDADDVLEAALAPSAAMSGKCSNYPNCPKEFCSACIPPADPPAVGAWTADADKYGNALNEAAWTFVDVCPEKSALLFNNTKQALRAAILRYAEVVAAQEASRGA